MSRSHTRPAASVGDPLLVAPNGEPRPLLYRYFRDTADLLLANYRRSGGQSAAANLGHNREVFCREFLTHVLPPRLTIGHCEILDRAGTRTGQLETVIIRDDAPRLT